MPSNQVIFVASEETARVEVSAPTDEHRRFDHPIINRDFFGSRDTSAGGPHASLKEYPAVSRLGAHFHPVDQFQLFFDSPGAWYQRRPIASVLLHYVDAFTTYGPFGADEGVLTFYTLRASGSDVTNFMPGSRERLIRRPGRNYHIDVGGHLGTPRDAGTSEIITLVEPEADGLAAYLLCAGAGAEISAPAAQSTAGQYYCVLSGSLTQAGRRYGPKALGWCETGAEAPVLQARADDGFEVLVAQFPKDTTAGLEMLG